MYKIYINETPLFLVNDQAAALPHSSDQLLVAHYPGRSKFLLHYIDMLEKSNRFEAVYLLHKNVKQLFKDFRHLYKRINAAGGLVLNPAGEALLIYRRGHWDLPKGKIEKGERKRVAAVREVMEETGIEELEIVGKLGKTMHTYRLAGGRRVLKYNYWYMMKSTQQTGLHPQVEEDIEQVVWMPVSQALAGARPMYGSIRDVLVLAEKR